MSVFSNAIFGPLFAWKPVILHLKDAEFNLSGENLKGKKNELVYNHDEFFSKKKKVFLFELFQLIQAAQCS